MTNKSMRMARFIAAIVALLFAACALARGPADLGEITIVQLPAEGRAMLAKIKTGGPFAYRQDGSVFGNREKLLPQQRSGYYREYTVTTPGARDRGARRIISGGTPPVEFFYTDDHYRSFKRIRE